MSTVDVAIEVKSFGQTNGKTYHARFNCDNLTEKEPKHPDSVKKMAEALLLLPAIICLSSEEQEALLSRAKAYHQISHPPGERRTHHGNHT